jgi:hypothetical protein
VVHGGVLFLGGSLLLRRRRWLLLRLLLLLLLLLLLRPLQPCGSGGCFCGGVTQAPHSSQTHSAFCMVPSVVRSGCPSWATEGQ